VGLEGTYYKEVRARYSRRHLAKMAAGTVPLFAMAAQIDSRVQGVRIGLQTYVFTANVSPPQLRLADTVIQSMMDAGIGECDLYAPIIEPEEIRGRIRSAQSGAPQGASLPPESAAALAAARQELASWRASAPLDYFRTYRKKFLDAGIEIHAISGFSGATPQEFSRTLEIADALGARLITLGINMPAAKLLAPIAEKHDVIIGLQGRPDLSITDPDAIARPESFLQAAALAKNYCISLDIGDAVGGGWDVLKFVQEHPDRIGLIYLKDRRKDRLSVPWGQGDTPIREILRLIRDKQYPILCYIDCDYKTEDRPGDVKRSLEYVKAALS